MMWSGLAVQELCPKLLLSAHVRFTQTKKGGFVIVYLILILTSVLVGLVAVLLWRNQTVNPKVFLTAALLNAAALLGILCYQQRRKK